jgi:hypothetical protein
MNRTVVAGFHTGDRRRCGNRRLPPHDWPVLFFFFLEMAAEIQAIWTRLQWGAQPADAPPSYDAIAVD